MATITFRTNGGDVRIGADVGERLIDVARRADVAVDAPCGGNGICGKCRVRLLSGVLDHPCDRRIDEAAFEQGWRLACLSRVCGDAVIEVPDAATAYRGADPAMVRIDRARVALGAAGIAFESGIARVRVDLDPPSDGDAMPDNERLSRQLQALTGVRRVTIGFPALQKLAKTLRQSDFSVDCVIERADDTCAVLDVLPKAGGPACGLAVDLGTTSVAALLVDLSDGRVLAGASAANGQVRYGADVIERIIESGREGGAERLQRAVIDATLRPLIAQLCADADIAPAQIYRACIAGNTAMNHLLLGLYSEPVRMAPYVPTFFRCDDVPASALGLGLCPAAKIMLAPNVGSYVGGDITAGCFASMLWQREEMCLFIDLGTNGELVFGNRDFMMCCACSAGPAFEGGGISCGMRAIEGAIDRMSVDPETMEPDLSIIGSAVCPLGICGSGIIDAVAGLFRAKIIDGRGRFIRRGRRVRFDENGMGEYVIAFREDTGAARDITINEVDIDNFIRAKGAVFSAAMTMLGAAGMDPQALERVYIAGGIGSGIDMDNAVAVGMLPDIDRGRFSYVGNTSLTGVWAMLASRECRERVDALASGMTYLELSSEPGYMDAFVAACFLPHTDGRLFPSAT